MKVYQECAYGVL